MPAGCGTGWGWALYADPDVALFGLETAVMAIGSDFLEVVAPTRADAAAARHLERFGEGGYMLIVQVADIEAVRTRAREMGVRDVWSVDLPDVSATHLHPVDVGGTILSVDAPMPPETWRWAGPSWTGQTPNEPGSGAIRRARVAVPEPADTAGRWGKLLGVDIRSGAATLELGGGQAIEFVEGSDGLCEVAVDAPRDEGATAIDVGRLRVVGAD